MTRRVVIVVVAVLAVAALVFFLGRSGQVSVPGVSPKPVTPSTAPPTLPTPTPVENGAPGASIVESFTVVEGTQLVDSPTVREENGVNAWSANLDLTGDPAQVFQTYVQQLTSIGYTVTNQTQPGEGLTAYTVNAEKRGMLPGAQEQTATDIAQIDVILPTGDVPGYVRILVAHLGQ